MINCHLFAINCIADVRELISEGDYHRNIYSRQPGNRPISGGRGRGGLRTGSFAICQFFETGDQQRWQRNEKKLTNEWNEDFEQADAKRTSIGRACEQWRKSQTWRHWSCRVVLIHYHILITSIGRRVWELVRRINVFFHCWHNTNFGGHLFGPLAVKKQPN